MKGVFFFFFDFLSHFIQYLVLHSDVIKLFINQHIM